jgi:thimet oligopeptidase
MSNKSVILFSIILIIFVGCSRSTDSTEKKSNNPFLVDLNVPIDYANVSATDIEEYANLTLNEVVTDIESIKNENSATFNNVFSRMDGIINKVNIASSNCFMLYWVSPDSLSRLKGFAGYQLLDSLSTSIYSDKVLYNKMQTFSSSESYLQLKGHRKKFVDDIIISFKQSGVNLDEEQLLKFKNLTKEITHLTSNYSDNMNASNEILILNEHGAEGLPENFKDTYKVGETKYEIPIINATRRPVLNNAKYEKTRRAYYYKFYNRASDKNLDILDSLVQKRHELAKIMGYESYAAYNLNPKMAKNPEAVWRFINDLIFMSKEKARSDIEILKNMKNNDLGNGKNKTLQPWDIYFYNNQILKLQFQVDHEKIREYLPMEQCLEGVFTIYQELLGLEFRKVKIPSVWHEEVEMYEVYEKDNLKGRFYLDLFPRPNKETWFYGVGLTAGRATEKGYVVPVAMLLGNFTKPTESLPSLLSHSELSTLFHEFGHIVNGMSYHGEFSFQSDSKSDFAEAMSQIFENWIWDYDMLSSFARHFETGEVLPKETFDNMLKAKNLNSGLSTLISLRKCVYDMNLYDKYNPEIPVNTDDIWKNIDEEFDVMPMHVDGTHVQASWIHINTHPVYYYGYLWSEVYAQDMFTEFKKNGLKNQETGMKYRKLILANGTQRNIVEAVEEFLGRPSNNEAFIMSLGLD